MTTLTTPRCEWNYVPEKGAERACLDQGLKAQASKDHKADSQDEWTMARGEGMSQGRNGSLGLVRCPGMAMVRYYFLLEAMP